MRTDNLGWLTARPVAHRGYHDIRDGRVENTLPAFAAAAARGFAIECDVQLTADGAVVVFHDATLDRLTTATGAVAAKTLAEVRAARFRVGVAGIPTLDELAQTAARRVPLVIELKSEVAGSSEPLAAAVAQRLAAYTGPVAVMSFEPATMAAMRRVAPRLPRGLIVDAFRAADYPGVSAAARFALRHLLATPSVQPQFVACDVKRLPALAPGLLRRLGRPLLTWTVRTPEQRATASAWADQMIFEGFDPEA